MLNDAMLGKQVWCLFHERNSLVYKVFRAKYFQSGNIFDAKESSRCSFAWRSILQAREGVLRGARWRLGNGKDISIWQHHWLPSEGGGCVLSHQQDQSFQAVQDLFMPSSRRWNEEQIDVNFYTWEAAVIKGIHVSQAVDLDMLVWPLTSDGMYSVRSVYRLYVEIGRIGSAELFECGGGQRVVEWYLEASGTFESSPFSLEICSRGATY